MRLRMLRNSKLTIASILAIVSVTVAHAQETSPSGTPVATPSPVASQPSVTPSPSVAGSPTPSVTQSPARSVKISFLPPPMEGTISLGIFDGSGKLVRTLVQEGNVDEFEVGADALVAKWDGKDDHDADLPAGKYRARGFSVGHLKIDDIGQASSPPADLNAATHAEVKLVMNPLSNST